jgi:hypothetical protein
VPAATAAASPAGAAELRTLKADGVVRFIKGLGVSDAQAERLAAHEVDGAALLETSVDELCDRYGLSGGAAHAVMRAIAPAVEEAQSVTLTIFPPTGRRRKSSPYTMRLTPDRFQRTFGPQAPLRLLNSSGSFLRIATSLAEAAEASQKGLFLHASRSYDDDLTSLLGFSTNCATALEIKSTLALAGSEHLRALYGQLELVNEGQVVELTLSRGGKKTRLELAPDGLVVSASSSSSSSSSGVVLFNSAKHTPSESHIDEVLENVATLEEMLAAKDWASMMTTDPPEAKAQLRARAHLRVVPFLSGDNFSAAVAAECLKRGVGIVRPSGEGFVVKVAGGAA